MKSLSVYIVEKFFPTHCPKCNNPFRSYSDFSIYAGGFGESFIKSKINMAKQFPELFKIHEFDDGVFEIENKYDIDYIICNKCKNVTLRIGYATKQVLEQNEAERLINEEGFTCWTKGIAKGNMTQEYIHLSFLGAADLNKLHGLVISARDKTSKIKDATKRGDSFTKIINPTLLEIVKKLQNKQTSVSISNNLSIVFGKYWDLLDKDCRSFLITAEILRNELERHSETNNSIDFSPAVIAYSKALEKGLLIYIFEPFKNLHEAEFSIPTVKQPGLEKSVQILNDYLANRRELTLGDMAFCLKNVGCKMFNIDGNIFSKFLEKKVGDINNFNNIEKYPNRVIKYIQKFRNKSAHIARLSKEECTAARSYLLEEPVLLLVRLLEILIKC
jgi:hypothetical protein